MTYSIGSIGSFKISDYIEGWDEIQKNNSSEFSEEKYEELNKKATLIDEEINYINSLPEWSQRGPSMSAREKEQKTNELENQKSQIQQELQLAQLEAKTSQLVSYRNEFLEKFGLKGAGSLRVNSQIMGTGGSSSATAPKDETDSELNEILNGFKGGWYNIRATKGDFG